MSHWEGELEREIDGKKYTCHWRVDNNSMIHINCGGTHSKSARLGGHFQNPKALAEILFGELIDQMRRGGF
jgi:hypothetical protein